MNYLKTLFLDVIGEYEPIIVDDKVLPDIPWILSALLFILVLYCCFRALGGLLKRA